MTIPKFYIQPGSEIPASQQLASQIGFAIASKQVAPGSRLPSTRQLAMQTGLHRNTITRVYSQLEADGLIEARAGSGMYVRESGAATVPDSESAGDEGSLAEARGLVREAIDGLSQLGYSLAQVRLLMVEAIDWRQQCGAQAIATVPQEQMGVGRLLEFELMQELGLSVQAIALENLPPVLEENPSVTLLTTRYFLQPVEAVAAEYGARVIAVDVNRYEQEIEEIGQLDPNSCVGLVSISPEVVQSAKVVLASRHGDNLLMLSATPDDVVQLRTVVRRAQLIVCGRSSVEAVKGMMGEMRSQLIRSPKVLVPDSYISKESLSVLARALDLD
ncbi:MAG: GntR family transcriptional regulator [Cyanobacteria bacterium J06597_1]